MKKVLWLVLVSLMVVPMSFAQQTSGLRSALVRKVAEEQPKTAEDIAKERVLEKLDDVRFFVTQSKREDLSIIMQEVLELAKRFSVYEVASSRNVAGLMDLAQQIESPILPGWFQQGKTEMFVVSREIDEFAGVYSHEWGSQEPTDELMRFSETLKLYSVIKSEQDLKEYNHLMQVQKGFLKGVNNLSANDVSCADNVSQSLIRLAEEFYSSTACAQNPALRQLVLRRFNQPVTIGGKTRMLAAWTRRNSEWKILEEFTCALEKASK